MEVYRSCLFLILIILVAGCAQDQKPQSVVLQSKLEQTTKNVASLQTQISALKGQVSTLQNANDWRNIVEQGEGVAYLTPADDGYSAIKLPEGYITVALINVRPYANGRKITLRFGNPMAATLTGVRMTLDWGKTDAKGDADNAGEKTRDVTLLNPLFGGSWTQETFVLDSLPPSQLGFVRVRNVSHGGMELIKRY